MRRHKERHAHLREVPMFAACTDAELAEIARLAEEITVPAGKVLVREGERGHEFYVVVSGRAEVTRKGVTVAVLEPGDHFGELALLDPHPRTASVTMLIDGEVLEMTQREFWTLLTDVPSLARKVLQGLARRMHADERAQGEQAAAR